MAVDKSTPVSKIIFIRNLVSFPPLPLRAFADVLTAHSTRVRLEKHNVDERIADDFACRSYLYGNSLLTQLKIAVEDQRRADAK